MAPSPRSETPRAASSRSCSGLGSRARWVVSAVVVVAAVCSAHATTLTQAWQGVQQSLGESDLRAASDRVDELLAVARDAGVERMTPYAAALVVWAGGKPRELGEAAVELALRLDPGLPSAHFLVSRWRWQDGHRFQATVRYAWGWAALVAHPRSRALLMASGVIGVLLPLAAVLMATVMLQTLRFVPELVHDAWELGSVLFDRTNAVVFAIVVVSLPLFAGLGPVWLIAYLFGMVWVYMPPLQKATAIVAWLLLVMLVPAAEVWQQLAMREMPLADRVGDMLEHRRVDPVTLQEFASLAQPLDESKTYRLLLGELLRLHGDTAGARMEFQRAVLLDDSDALPFLYLGNLAFEEGNMPSAVQNFSSAVDRDPGNALAFYNLSFAYDGSYRFQEADQARQRARELGGQALRDLEVERPSGEVVYPTLGRHSVRRLVAELPEETRAISGLEPPDLKVAEWLASPLSFAFLATGILGAAVTAARRRWMWTGQACVRCGNVFCARCKTTTESTKYCSQCISVFLKRDMVSIEQQTTKLAQVRRWERWSEIGHRVISVLVPGGGQVLQGKWVRGFLVGFAALLCLSGALIWLPMFFRYVEPVAAVVPVQALLLVWCGVLWFMSIRAAWHRR